VNAVALLERRVAELDHGLRDSASTGVLDGDLTHFIRILQQTVPAGLLPDASAAQTATAEQADGLVRRCELLERLAAQAPRLVDGPLDLSAQHWVTTAGRTGTPVGPDESRFVSVAASTDGSGSATGPKPFGVGVFTSTQSAGDHGMWRRYLTGYEGTGSLYPMPWQVWRLGVRSGVRVYEVGDAARWVRLISGYPRETKGYLHPDWTAVAGVYDAVHITLRAVAATQGLSFATSGGPTASPYWDTEQTFWLRWCFSTRELVEIVAGPDGHQRPGAPGVPGRAAAAPPARYGHGITRGNGRPRSG
jgi:hypothetical protein